MLSQRSGRAIRLRSRGRESRSLVALPPHPFRYALIATLGVGVGLAILSAVSSLATVLTYVGIALFLSIAMEPLLTFAVRRGIRRGVATLLIAIVLLVLLAGLTIAVIPAATMQVATVGQQALVFAESIPHQAWFEWLSSNLPGGIDLDAMLRQLTDVLGDPEQILAIGGGLLRVGGGIIDGITGTVVVAALTVYFVATLPSMKSNAYRLIAQSRRNTIVDLTEEILQSVGRYVGGQLVLASINAAFTFVLTSAIGSPAPSLLAIIAFIGALIPVVGTVLGTGVAVLLTLTVNPVGALVVLIVMVIYMQVESYLLSPRVMSKAVAVPGALVIVAALGGAALGGVLGALVAVPVAAAGLLVVERVVVPSQQRS